jgi:hypothetical protein
MGNLRPSLPLIRLAALFGHAPGLRVLYGWRMPRSLLKRNLLAIALTLAASAIGLRLSGVPAALAAFSVGHLSWGVYLAGRVEDGDRI